MPENLEYDAPFEELIYTLNEAAEEYVAGLPHSPDGEDCRVALRHQLIDSEGELTDLPDAASELYFEIVFGFECDDEEHSFLIKIPLKSGLYCRAQQERATDECGKAIASFFTQIEGECHREYLSRLARERYLTNLGITEDAPPFDYKSFFIGASVISIALILMLITVNEILPRLL